MASCSSKNFKNIFSELGPSAITLDKEFVFDLIFEIYCLFPRHFYHNISTQRLHCQFVYRLITYYWIPVATMQSRNGCNQFFAISNFLQLYSIDFSTCTCTKLHGNQHDNNQVNTVLKTRILFFFFFEYRSKTLNANKSTINHVITD